MAQSSDSAEEMITGVNVTPLVDVVLVLLVVLMVTSSYLAAQSIPVDLPKAATGESANTLLTVSVLRDGTTYLDGQVLNDAQFRARVHAVHAQDRDARAVIAADGGAAHRSVVHVIDLLRQEQVTHFALNVDPDVSLPAH